MNYLIDPVDLKDRRHLLVILGTLVIFFSIPLTVALVQQSREPTSRAVTTPNDPKFPTQWNLPKIRAPEAWDVTWGSASIKVAVVDTGIMSTLADLQGQLGPGYNAITPGGSTEDDFLIGWGLGTKIASVIGAQTNNGQAIAGTAWYITMLPVKVCTDMGLCLPADVAEGINWATSNGAQIINISMRLDAQRGYPSPEVEAAIA